MILKRSLCVALVVACGLAAVPAAARADEAAVQQKLIDEKLPSVATVRFLLKGGDQDEPKEALGTVIEPGGLVLISNEAFDGIMTQMGGPASTPTEIKVFIGDDAQGAEAKLVARDSDLQLAWIQLKEPPAKPLAYIDLEHNSAPAAKISDSVYVVSQMSKFFDRAGVVFHGHIAAIVKKPRDLIIPGVGLAGGELGSVVYDAAGKIVGVTSIILPERDEVQGFPGGMRGAMRGIVGASMIIPAADVASATKRAKEMAASGAGEATPEPKKEDGKEAPKDPAAPGKTAPEQPK